MSKRSIVIQLLGETGWTLDRYYRGRMLKYDKPGRKSIYIGHCGAIRQGRIATRSLSLTDKIQALLDRPGGLERIRAYLALEENYYTRP